MKTIIFSDTHLTERFNFKKFIYLKKIIESADKVIINGDFWDGYFTTFEKFVHSPWQQLFPLLKAKNTIYLPGNHDRDEWLNDKVNLFAEECTPQVNLVSERYNLHIEHGHKIAPTLSAYYPALTNKYNYVIKTGFLLESVGLNLFGTKPFVPFNYIGQQLKQHGEENNDEEQILVCGHSHLAEFQPEKNYINTGVINYNIGQYLLVDEDLHLMRERY